MCNSQKECNAICKAVHFMPLMEHEKQLNICHKCTLTNNPNVSSKTIYKTDLHVRLSYVDKYHAQLERIRLQA